VSIHKSTLTAASDDTTETLMPGEITRGTLAGECMLPFVADDRAQEFDANADRGCPCQKKTVEVSRIREQADR
jgi:hypothetical protein